MYATVANSDLIQVIVLAGGPGINVDIYCSYMVFGSGLTEEDYNINLLNSPQNFISINSDVCQMQAASIYNGGTTSITVAVQYQDSLSNTYVLLEVGLPARYTITYTADGAGWQVYNASGGRL